MSNASSLETLLSPNYQHSLVFLSYVISVIGAFVALTSARKIVRADGRINIVSTLVTGIALGGVGVWSMHFVGMLALRLDMGTAYSMAETLVSLVAAVGASSLALAYVAKAPQDLGRILIAGALLGLGVAVMHYLGMAGMRFGGFIRWSSPVVIVSVFIAVFAATAALWLAFNTRTLANRVVAAAIMGVAVCAMHYTGMAAADFICTTETPQAIPTGTGIISALAMPRWVIAMSIGAAFLICLDHLASLAASHERTAYK